MCNLHFEVLSLLALPATQPFLNMGERLKNHNRVIIREIKLRWNSSNTAVIALTILLVTVSVVAKGDPSTATSASASQPLTHATRMVYSKGDQERWSDTAFNDESWTDFLLAGLPAEKSNYWIRNHVTLTNSDTEMPYDHAVMVGILGS
ncbi:MAG: hypothetical protein ACJAYF_001374 [Arenicella sp.]|jgi:hypothetical protein